LYEDPIIYGEGFYIKAEGIESPEIIIKYSPTSTLESSRRLAYDRLHDLGVKSILGTEGDEDIFAFPPAWRGLLPGAKWSLTFKDKIPVPHEFKSKIDYPTASCKFLAWELEFPMQEVLDFLDRKKFYSILSSFLLGKEIVPPLERQLAVKLKNSLEKQLRHAEASHTIKLKRIDLVKGLTPEEKEIKQLQQKLKKLEKELKKD
jgi:hypothetical protein